MCSRRQILIVEPATHRVLAPPQCPPAVRSRRVGCCVPWHPIAVAHCSAAAYRCSSRDARARSSIMRSRVGCLVPPRAILSLLADDCGLYRHLTSAVLLPFRCSAVSSLHSRDAGARSSTSMSCAVPLLPPSLLTTRVTHLASSSLAPRRVGTMRWHTHVCRVAASIHPLVQLTSSPTAYGQTPSASPPCKVAATATSLLRLAARVSTLAPSPPRAIISLSLSLHRSALPPRNARL
jgi:hypothetical protein